METVTLHSPEEFLAYAEKLRRKVARWPAWKRKVFSESTIGPAPTKKAPVKKTAKTKKKRPVAPPAEKHLFYIIMSEQHEQRFLSNYRFRRFSTYEEACDVAQKCAVQYKVRMHVLARLTAFETATPPVVQVP